MDFRLEFSASCTTYDEPDNYLVKIAGTAYHQDEDDGETLAGAVRLFYADIESAAGAGFDPYYILDMEQATEPYYLACFDVATEDLKPPLGYDAITRNLLILDRLELLPEFRGRWGGLAILDRCIEQFAHSDTTVVLKCYPLQFEGGGTNEELSAWLASMKMEAFDRDQRKCTSKLKKYYRKLGFKPIGRSDFMFLHPDLERPTLASIRGE